MAGIALGTVNVLVFGYLGYWLRKATRRLGLGVLIGYFVTLIVLVAWWAVLVFVIGH